MLFEDSTWEALSALPWDHVYHPVAASHELADQLRHRLRSSAVKVDSASFIQTPAGVLL
jgi:hypothetical protein